MQTINTCAINEWIEWGGGVCPIPEHFIVRGKLRNGHETGMVRADYTAWRHVNSEYDMIAYMIVGISFEVQECQRYMY